MTVEVRLFATFRNNRGKKVIVNLDSPTPRMILAHLGISPEEVAILLVNGRDGTFDQALAARDYLSVFPPVGGG